MRSARDRAGLFLAHIGVRLNPVQTMVLSGWTGESP